MLATQPNELGWQMLCEHCDWQMMRDRKCIFLICLYQLIDKSEVWCLHQTWDEEGYKMNNDAAKQMRDAYQPKVSSSRPADLLGAFDVMD